MHRPIPQHAARADDARALPGARISCSRTTGRAAESCGNSLPDAVDAGRPWRWRVAVVATTLGVAVGLGGCVMAPKDPSGAGEPAATAESLGDADEVELRARREALLKANEPYRPTSLPSLSLTPPVLYELLAAEIAAQRQQLSTAYSSYSSLAAQTRDARLARRATEIALNGRAFEQALTSARLWSELDPMSDEPKQAIEALLLATNRLAEAEPALSRRMAAARKNQQIDDFYSQLQRTLVRIEDRKGGWAMLRRLSADDLERLSARRARAAVAEAAGDRQAAADEALAAHEMAPRDPAMAIQAARLLQELPDNGTARATRLLDDFVRKHPDDQSARLALGRIYLLSRQTGAARATFDAALQRTPNDPALLYLAAQGAYQAKDLDGARRHLNKYTALPTTVERDNAPAWVFLGQIAEDQNQPVEAIDYLKRVEGGELYLSALVRRAMLMARGGDYDGASKLIEATPARNQQEQTALISARAGILREAQRYPEAFDVLDQALARAPDNPDLLYDHAMAAEKVERLDTLEKSLRHLISLRPENAHAYNALGYTLADRNQRLPEALALIKKANELAPDDAQIIDSLGWVHFRLGNTEEALVHLRRAYAMKPDVEVAAHLGEVLWQSGARDEAMKVWREASGREPKNEVLRGTLARLNISL
ncbi:MAG: tetratricopeptide repeat protein [Burkholderiaceae bacterium]